MLSKEKDMIIGNLRIMTLIKGDLQPIVRMHLEGVKEELIEKNNRFSKTNCGLRKITQSNLLCWKNTS